MSTLLMSSRHTEDDQALWRAAIRRGWSVARARGIHLPEIDDSEIIIYVEAFYAPTTARSIVGKLAEKREPAPGGECHGLEMSLSGGEKWQGR